MAFEAHQQQIGFLLGKKNIVTYTKKATQQVFRPFKLSLQRMVHLVPSLKLQTIV